MKTTPCLHLDYITVCYLDILRKGNCIFFMKYSTIYCLKKDFLTTLGIEVCKLFKIHLQRHLQICVQMLLVLVVTRNVTWTVYYLAIFNLCN